MPEIYAPPGSDPVFPASVQTLQELFSQTTFPQFMTADEKAEFHLFQVKLQPQPEHDPRLQICTQLPPAFVDARWVIGWSLRPATPEEIAEWDEANRPPPDWSSFAIEINQNPIVAAWRDALPIGPFGLLVGGTAVASLGKPETLMAALAQLKASGALPEPVQQVLKEQATAKSLPNEIIQIFN
jgi:hypothetical protein